MMNLYPHQEAINQACRDKFRSGIKNLLVVLPTGGGKSILSASQIASSQNKGLVSFFVVPRKQLIEQMHVNFDNFNIPHSFIASGYPCNPHHKTFICSTKTLVNKLDVVRPNIIFIDETHIGGASLDKIINYYKSMGTYVVGLSATPLRLDGKGLGCWYDDMVEGPTTDWLIKNKYLSDYDIYAPSSPDVSGLGKTAGDFNKGALAALMEQDRVLVGDAVKYYKKLAYGKKAVCFCSSRKHSKETAAIFSASGIPAAHIDGETAASERKRIIQDFAKGKLLVLCNVEIFTTGFDLATAAGMDVTVECLIALRPTMSLALWLQMVGRALRKKDYPAIIIDHAGNTERHLLPCMEREWTLKDIKKGKKGNGEKVDPVRQCTVCFHCHTPSAKCPKCGHIYEIKERKIEHVDGDLVAIDKETLRVAAKKEQAMAKSIDDLIALGRMRGYKYPHQWAAKIMSARMQKGKR